MKRIFLLLVGVCLMASNVFAGDLKLTDWADNLPAMNQAVIFSLDNSKWEYASTITLVSFLKDDLIKLDAGYTPSQEIIALASIKLVNVGDYIKFPVIEKLTIEPFIYVGLDRIENFKELGEYDYGVGAKIISIKF